MAAELDPNNPIVNLHMAELHIHEMRHRGFWYDDPLIWKPGAKFFSIATVIEAYPAPWLTALMFLGCYWTLIEWRQTGTLTKRGFAQLAITITCILFLVASNALYHFRWKELHAIFPLLVLLCSLSLVQLVQRLPSTPRRATGQP